MLLAGKLGPLASLRQPDTGVRIQTTTSFLHSCLNEPGRQRQREESLRSGGDFRSVSIIAHLRYDRQRNTSVSSVGLVTAHLPCLTEIQVPDIR
jgi:hypothetical protein